MREADFFSKEMREAVHLAVQNIESQTSAELVVRVSRKSDTYRDLDYLAGAGLAFGVLLILLFHPLEFSLLSMPFFVLLAFFLGSHCVARIWAVKRRLLSRQRRHAAVFAQAAKAFVEQGIGRTSGRTGLLVYLSICERVVVTVADVGVNRTLLETGRLDMEAALQKLDRAACLKALQAWGPLLGKALPRQVNDVNELPDQLVHS